MTEPRTAAGRALMARLLARTKRTPSLEGLVHSKDILAIEAEARSEGPGLDALREALTTCWMELEREHGHSSAWPDDTWPSCLLTHAALRAAHAALTAQENPNPSPLGDEGLREGDAATLRTLATWFDHFDDWREATGKIAPGIAEYREVQDDLRRIADALTVIGNPKEAPDD